MKTRGVTTNQYGYFSLTLPSGNYKLIFSYVGYSPKIINVDFNKDVSAGYFASSCFCNHTGCGSNFITKAAE